MVDQVKDAGELDGNKKEDWMNAKWRPMMGWMYMLVCTCDFVIFPVLWSIFHAIIHSGNVTQWQPLTLQGAGLFHMAMGAIIGVAAFGRTQEKLAGANNGGLSTPSFGSSSPAPSSFGSPAPAPAFGASSSSSFTPAPAPAPAFGSATPAVNANGQKVVPAQSMPEL
ncbi:Holin of 3TMs, for gene-transfer release [uncultured Caudovirales phage]|uniref:Holin of 3TMs, for gene-transfer release n=1 Tax=uncultured Caudovirales phage TaxID=2100421 RepID=A0A6J5L3R1_9CAUD|nr:Holin of 3TMs, for gene-transfer release [uncultured Caudovirales phage]